MKKLLFSTVILFLIFNILQGQHHEEIESLQSKFEKSDVVIEGKIVDQESYFDEDQKLVFTRYEIDLFKVFKGAASTQIEFHTKGGQTESHALTISHQERYFLGQEGIFFLKENVRGQLNPSGNAIRFYNHLRSPAEEKGKVYKDIESEIYEPLQNIAGHFFQIVQPNSLEKVIDEWVQEVNASSVDCETAIEYGIEGITISFPFVEFDITAKSNVDNLLLSKSTLLLDYPTSLGTNIVSNGIIEVTKDELINDDAYLLNTTDETNQKMRIQINGNNTIGTLSDVQLFEKPLCHIKLQLNTILQTGMAFDNVGMQGLTEFYDPVGGGYKNYRCVFASGDYKFNFADFTFFPPVVNAGVGDTLFIVGTGFGTDEGFVQFRNAETDDASSFGYYGSIQQNRVEWSDQFIAVEIPSRATSITVGSDIFVPFPASGLIRLKLSDNTIITPMDSAEVEVFYSISDDNTNLRRRNLANINGEGGYTFHLSEELNNIPNARQVIEQVLFDWQNATCVNFKLSPDIVSTNSEANDGINVIGWTSSLAGGTLMQTFSHTQGAVPNGNGMQVNWARDIDIMIKDSTFWYIGLPDIADTTKYDFYAAFSHEVGHGHQLNHVLGEQSTGVKKLMVVGRGRGVETRTIGEPAKQGGQDVIENNFVELDGGGLAASAMERINGCINSVNKVAFDPNIELTAFPNPTQNQLTIMTDLPSSKEVTFSIFNMIGRRVFQSQNINLKKGKDKIIVNSIDYPNGVYFILLETDSGFNTIKFIKQ